MKLIRFTIADSATPQFGVVVQDQTVPFLALQRKAGESYAQHAINRRDG